MFATRFIPAGTIIWARDELDQTLSPERVASAREPYRSVFDKYCYVDRRGDYVLCWDHARYLNHSCAATCLAPGYEFEIAARDILPGDELTDDYGALNLDVSFVCRCGLDSCRGVIKPDDAVRHGEHWDRLIQASFVLIPGVEQPLWELVREKEKVLAALAGRVEIASCMVNHVDSRPAPRALRSVTGEGQR